jgi:hypothetical protein
MLNFKVKLQFLNPTFFDLPLIIEEKTLIPQKCCNFTTKQKKKPKKQIRNNKFG